MDVLDNYKKAWGNQASENSQFSTLEIYKMAHSKSSSIVKWIFIIGILEFVILNSLYFFIDTDKAMLEYEKLGLENFIYYSQIAAYVILFYFLWMFYQNYKRISTIDSTKILMKKIIKTRKTVRNYVLFNLGYLALIMIVVTATTINTNIDELNNKQIFLVIIATLIATLLILGILWLFYQLLYGILLRKLNRNYKELAKLDDAN
ncbi:hypothetical protein [Polaribacter aquimarinus]|uniref:Beta-carotene 15,15'-monooxygenase n=1 Tax=Polaribacter aquimarinus TaxID=2100726 RepID=A0A2U2J8Z4_9FLAO|nr:hypothetical protein [Polaribacter aquimarinus]PWG04818.1 hypothetical protein DIS07_10115 [Polaribacter aquimarinus]